MKKSKKKTVHESNAPDSEKVKMPHSVAHDRRLSFEAVGVYGCLCCLHQSGEPATLEALMRMNPPDSEKVITAALEELERYGHIGSTKTDLDGAPYSRVLRNLGQDRDLSSNAKGIMLYVLSMPHDFDHTIDSLVAAHGRNGPDTDSPRNPESVTTP